jgi:hypothetical protein
MGFSTASSQAAALIAILCLAAPALAADPSVADKSLAQSLFDEGRRLMDAGRYSDACPRFADSERLDPGGGTVLNLALCYERSGKLALAYATYNDALSLAIEEHRAEREAFARERIADIAPRLPHLTVRISAVDGARVSLDGSDLPPSAWGVLVPVDPGRHTIEATARGREPFETAVTLAEGETREVPIELAQAAVSLPPPPGEVRERPLPREGTRRSPAFYVLGSLGLASLGASAVTGFMALSAHQSVEQKCDVTRGVCTDPSGIDDAQRARTMAWVSTWTLAGGALGVILALSVPMQHYVIVSPAPRGAALLFQGSWK